MVLDGRLVRYCISGFNHCSYDGEPFVLHDPSFRRTSNIGDVFPSLIDVEACWLNMSQIKQLDAGSWFLRVSTIYLLYDNVTHFMGVEK